MNQRAANFYRRVDLQSAPKGQILERLYDRFDRDLATARAAILAKDIKGKSAAIDHALQIVVNLEAALDRPAAPELCANLVALYNFVIARLTLANMNMSVKPLDEVARVMTPIGDAFRQAHKMASAGAQP